MKVKLQEVIEALYGAGMDRMMEEFIYDLPAGRAQDALDAAIRGKGAFRRFKDRLYDFDLQEKWYKYRDDCYEQIARDWCERFGIEIEE